MLLLLLYTARGAVSENKFPKGPIEKAHEFSITTTERIERRERGGCRATQRLTTIRA